MDARPTTSKAVNGPPFTVGVLVGCVPILIAVAAAIGIVHCRIGPTSYAYCSSADAYRVLGISVVALGSVALELVVGLLCLLTRRLRRLGAGLLVMVVAFLPVAILALYIASAIMISNYQPLK